MSRYDRNAFIFSKGGGYSRIFGLEGRYFATLRTLGEICIVTCAQRVRARVRACVCNEDPATRYIIDREVANGNT